MMLRGKDRSFTSDADKFLKNFDKAHPKRSAAEQAEIDKATRITTLRDHAAEDSIVDNLSST